MSPPELTYDIYQIIIQAVADSSRDGVRDRTCAETLWACCLVNLNWRRLAQPILNQTIMIDTQNHLNRRIMTRSNDHHLGGLRRIVFQETWRERFSFNVDSVLQALPSSQLLRSFICFGGAQLPESSDENDRALVHTSHFSPQPLALDLSGLRKAVLGPISFGPGWVPFLRAVPNLRYLTFHHCGWCVSSSFGCGQDLQDMQVITACLLLILPPPNLIKYY
jgi:hypothetical protein